MDGIKRRKLSTKERKAVYDKCHGHCAYCGCEIAFRGFNVEHMTPLSNGGNDTFDNMLPACRSCNHYKGTIDLEGFRTYLGGLHDRMLRDNVNYRTLDRYKLIANDPAPVKFYFKKLMKENRDGICRENIRISCKDES